MPKSTKKDWAEKAKFSKEREEEIVSKLKDMAENYEENPEMLADLIAFGSKFYNYSPKNTTLIYMQNQGATYVQSFQKWKEMGVSVNKGAKGIKVWVPVEVTVLQIDNQKIPLSSTTKEQKELHKQGKIEAKKGLKFKIGSTFDISQTTYPKEKYPDLFHMGHESQEHELLTAAMIEYAWEELGATTTIEDVKSIALRGYFTPSKNHITISDQLESTEKLSTMIHEVAHAIMHNDRKSRLKPESQIEMEADALSIMLEAHIGISLTDSRKRHFADHYRTYKEIHGKADIQQKYKDIKLLSYEEVMKTVSLHYKEVLPHIERVIEQNTMSQKVQEEHVIHDGVDTTSPTSDYLAENKITDVPFADVERYGPFAYQGYIDMYLEDMKLYLDTSSFNDCSLFVGDETYTIKDLKLQMFEQVKMDFAEGNYISGDEVEDHLIQIGTAKTFDDFLRLYFMQSHCNVHQEIHIHPSFGIYSHELEVALSNHKPNFNSLNRKTEGSIHHDFKRDEESQNMETIVNRISDIITSNQYMRKQTGARSK